MSRIADLGENYKNLPNILAEYYKPLDEADDLISLKGKTIERANVENPSWQLYYDRRRVELKILVDYFELQIAKVRGRLYRSYTESSHRDLSDRQKEKYIDNEEKFLEINELYLEVKELYTRYQGVVESFTARGYALNNITRARVADVHEHLLD